MKRKIMTVFYLIDTSGYVKNERLAALNHSIEEGVNGLQELSESNGNIDTRVAIVSFSSGSKWISKGAESVSTYKHKWIENGGCRDLGAALTLLNKDLDSILGVYGDRNGQDFKPVFILMLFDCPTDDYLSALEVLNKNVWFKKGIKIAFGMGDETESFAKDVLINFTGNEEAIITTTDLNLFRRLFGFYEIPEKDRISMQNGKEQNKGVEKCRLLKKIRQDIADANGIEYKTSECTEPEGCIGTCPKCEAELNFLYAEIEKKIQNGEKIVMPNTFFELTAESDRQNQSVVSDNITNPINCPNVSECNEPMVRGDYEYNYPNSPVMGDYIDEESTDEQGWDTGDDDWS